MTGSFITDDLSAMLSVADFALSATWTEGGKDIDGIFDDEDVEVDRGDGLRHIHRTAHFRTQSSHGVSDGDTLTIESVAYTVAFQQDNGTGLVELYLEKV